MSFAVRHHPTTTCPAPTVPARRIRQEARDALAVAAFSAAASVALAVAITVVVALVG